MYYALIENHNGCESAFQISKSLYDKLFASYGNRTTKVYDTGMTFNSYHIYTCEKPLEQYNLSVAAIRTFNYCYIA